MEAVTGTKRRAEAAGLQSMERDVKLARLQEGNDAFDSRVGVDDTDEVDGDAGQKLDIQQQLAAIEEERKLLLDGKHAGYKERCTVFQNRQLSELAKAVTIRDLQLKNVELLYEYAKYAAEKVCMDSQKKLYELMLQELEERQRTLQERLTGVAETKFVNGARKLRSKVKTGEESTTTAAANVTAATRVVALLSGTDASGASLMDSGILTGALPSNLATAGQAGPTIMMGLEGAPPPPLTIALPSTDIMTDLKTMYREWRATAQRWRSTAASALLPARVERNKLYYGNDCYSRGDHVTVFSELTRQEYYGTMHFLAQNEVIVRLSDGTKARVPLQHLRHGRVSIYKASNAPTASTASTTNAHASGAPSAPVEGGAGLAAATTSGVSGSSKRLAKQGMSGSSRSRPFGSTKSGSAGGTSRPRASSTSSLRTGGEAAETTAAAPTTAAPEDDDTGETAGQDAQEPLPTTDSAAPDARTTSVALQPRDYWGRMPVIVHQMASDDAIVAAQDDTSTACHNKAIVYKRWTLEEIDALMSSTPLAAAWSRLNVSSQDAAAKFFILAHFGGMFVDSIVKINLETLQQRLKNVFAIPTTDVFAVRWDTSLVLPSFLAATANSPTLKALCETLCDNFTTHAAMDMIKQKAEVAEGVVTGDASEMVGLEPALDLEQFNNANPDLYFVANPLEGHA